MDLANPVADSMGNLRLRPETNDPDSRQLFRIDPPRFPAAAIREVALPFWIAKAEKDSWTHDQLIALVGALREDQTMPGDLVAWSLDVISGLRSRPTRRGPKSDRARDTKLAWTFGALCRSGFSGRAAKRHIAERWNIDPTTVESAVRRARRVWEFPAK